MSWLLFGVFTALMCAAVPLAVALGLSGVAVIAAAQMGLMSIPTTVYGGIAKYPLIAIPVFILAGFIFERSGVAARLVTLAEAIVGKRRGAAMAAVLVCMISAASRDRGRGLRGGGRDHDPGDDTRRLPQDSLRADCRRPRS